MASGPRFPQLYQIDAGSVAGPGSALAWSYQYFLLSFVRSKAARNAAKVFARLTAFFFKYFDYLLIDRKEALDAASAYYFLGRKAEGVLSDRELMNGGGG